MRPPRSRQPPIFPDERRRDTFRQKPWCSSDVLSATQRTATSGKNYWAILRGTGIPESIRAIGVSYSYWSRLDGRHASRPCSQWIDGAEQEPQRSKEKAAGMAGRGGREGAAASSELEAECSKSPSWSWRLPC